MPQQAAVQAVQISVKAVAVTTNGKWLSVGMRLANSSQGQITNVLVLAATLDSSTPLEPTLPWYVGDVTSLRGTPFGLSFPLGTMVAGQKHTLQVKGTCKVDSITLPFSVSTEVTVPPITVPAAFTLLNAKVSVTANEGPGLWNYTVYNNEASSSNNVVSNFQVRFHAPFVVRSTPPGWTAQTDGMTFVLWSVIDVHAQQGSQVQPGKSLAGFQIQSASQTSEGASFSAGSWNATSDTVGPLAVGTVLAPAHIE